MSPKRKRAPSIAAPEAAQTDVSAGAEHARFDAFYRDAFALSPDGRLLVDAATLLPILFNDAACRQVGYTREEYAQLPLAHHAPPGMEHLPRQHADQTLDAGNSEFDLVVRTKTGENRILHIWVRSLDFEGRPAFYAIQRDVTDQHRVQDELRHSHDLLDRTGRMAAVGGWQFDLDTQTLHWTPQVYRIHDLEPGSPISVATAIAFYAPEARAVIQAALKATIDHGTPFDLELPLETARGRRILVRAQGEADRVKGRITHIHGAFQDISERHRASEAHRLQSAALDAAVDAVVITDAKGTVEWVNQAFTTLTGYQTAEAIGRNPRDLLRSGRHSREFYADMWTTILSGRPWHGEVINRRKDGTDYTEEQTITPDRGCRRRDHAFRRRSSATSTSDSPWRHDSGNPRRWRRWDSWPAASRTTSTICSR